MVHVKILFVVCLKHFMLCPAPDVSPMQADFVQAMPAVGIHIRSLYVCVQRSL
jgi:hypothetical protein